MHLRPVTNADREIVVRFFGTIPIMPEDIMVLRTRREILENFVQIEWWSSVSQWQLQLLPAGMFFCEI